jgi:endogenous inhibitor of DNA gyrase (YacG/DUF329 family)
MDLKCPICKTEFPREPRAKSFPFCCSRCKMLDLGNWFNGEYVLSRPIDPETDSEAMEQYIRHAEQHGLNPAGTDSEDH